jgi:hypothetical protein
MKPTPPISSKEQVVSSMEQVESSKEPEIINKENIPSNNTDNLHFSSPQKLPAERDKQETEDSTLRIYPRRFANGSGNNENANTQDVKISGNVVDLRN